MNKNDYPITPAIRYLREHKINFEPFIYDYEEHGGTAQFAELFKVTENQVIKTIVLQNEDKKGLIVLMHGDKQISTRNLARQLMMKHIEPADPKLANKWTGYLVGGTTPFACKTSLPIYIESSIWLLEKIYINGGKRGFIIGMHPKNLESLSPKSVHVAIEG